MKIFNDMRDKMKIITDKKKELEIEITGETHTLCNALRKTLMVADEGELSFLLAPRIESEE